MKRLHLVSNKLIRGRFPPWRDNKVDVLSVGFSLWRRANAWNISFVFLFMVKICPLSTCFVPNYSTWKPKGCVSCVCLDAVNWNLMQLTTKSICVLLTAHRIVMHTCQCIYLCQHSFMPSGILWGTCAGASIRGVCSLAFCCVRSWTYASARFELVLISLCSLWSSVVHVCMDPPCISCSTILSTHTVSGLSSPHPPLFPLYIFYQFDRWHSSLLHGGSWLGWQDLPAIGAILSRSWLPIIVEAPGCLQHSFSI